VCDGCGTDAGVRNERRALGRLAVNRAALLSAPTMVALWALYLAATMWLMVAADDVAFDRKNDR
jgi:hypothetical protein